ncbi:MAG: alpha/beta hydrolase [Sulfitobacter sp.]|nr:alpha/beta hydrolase [Sulfitobacter sp.]
MKFVVFIVAIAGLIALIQWRASAHEARAVAENPPTGEFVDIDGTSVHYRVMGEGPDLVLIHGASGNLRDFTMGFAQDLSARYRVILFDRPGLGYTARPPGHGGFWRNAEETPAQQAALLQAAADRIGVRNPIVLGHSFGGIVALAWGLARPEETAALVLVSGVAEPWPGGLGWTYRVNGSVLGGALAVPVFTALVPDSYVVQAIGSIFSPQQAPEGYADHLGVGLSLRRESLRANSQQVNALRPHVVEMKKKYGTLTMPIEMIHGDADTIVPLDIHARVLVEDVPNGALKVLPGMGHMPQHTAPDEVIAAIDRAAARAGLR